MPGPEHFIFIPAIFLLGLILGFIMGSHAARVHLEEQNKQKRKIESLSKMSRGGGIRTHDP
ncbi:hypothetical protein [Pajaroellobacter abortibovis]|uniref:hypothetical protein n=1 Tax=Pajaroellobacter abortibovis TaxID=1882918 RepID=UPI0012EB92CB|nr:hypothetical protein [Pajaroellobacter abortibovis]